MDQKPVIAAVIAAVLVSAIILIAGAYITRHAEPPSEELPDTHIAIGSDDEFASSIAYVSGSGTESNPYVLSITRVDFSSGTGLAISNTSAHFLLKDTEFRFRDVYRDCLLRTGLGVRVVNSSNFVVSNISLIGCDLEVRLCSGFEVSDLPLLYHVATFDNCSDGLLADNRIQEVFIRNSTGIVVRGNLNTTIVLRDCHDSDICQNVIKRSGITMSGCVGCRVYSNEANYVTADDGTIESRISNNHIRNGTNGMHGAIQLNDAENVTVEDNVIEDCEWDAGIQLLYNVVNCTIVGNDISGCYGGISLRGASGCVVYHNNILSSRWSGGYILGNQSRPPDDYYGDYHGGGILDEQGWLNTWDGGYTGGGNYYFDYNGTDLYGGPAQDVPGADGIGDTPLIVYTYLPGDPGVDRFPLMAPFSY